MVKVPYTTFTHTNERRIVDLLAFQVYAQHLIRAWKHSRPPPIRNLRNAIHIRTGLPHHEQHQPRHITHMPHPALRNLIRPVHRRVAGRHLTRIRARADDIAPDPPLSQERRHDFA
jgi:hypothetical protein